MVARVVHKRRLIEQIQINTPIGQRNYRWEDFTAMQPEPLRLASQIGMRRLVLLR
jgi:hypothetical protein